MIIIRYLIWETLKIQLVILFILLLIFFCQKLVRILGAVVDGDIPTNLIFTLLGLGIPEMAQLILPLSLFLAILMTLGRLYTESEITAMHACGLSRVVLIKSTMILILIVMMVAAINVIWLSPLSARYQSEVKQNAQVNPGAVALAVGRFYQSSDGNNVLFIESVKGNKFRHVFLAQLHPEDNTCQSIVIAESGRIERRSDGSQVIILDKGTRFEGTAFLRDFRITEFTNYQAAIKYKKADTSDPSDADQASLIKLFRNPSPAFQSELHWRLTLILSVLIMAIMVVPLSAVNPRQGSLISMLPAILLYFIFFLLQSLVKSNGEKGQLNPAVWMWVVNLTYLSLAVSLNLRDTVMIRRLYAKFTYRDSV